MTEEARRVDPVVRPRVPLVVWPLLVVFAIGIGGVLVVLSGGRVGIPVAKHDLPAYHLISSDDLHTRRLWKRGLEDNVVRDAKFLEGRVTRRAIEKNDAITDDALTGVVDTSFYRGIRMRLRPKRSSALGTHPGDVVELHLAPTMDGADLKPATVDALLLDVVAANAAPAEYVVAVRPQDVARLLALLGRSELLVTPAD